TCFPFFCPVTRPPIRSCFRWWETFASGALRRAEISPTFRGPPWRHSTMRRRSGSARALRNLLHLAEFNESRIGRTVSHVPHLPLTLAGGNRALCELAFAAGLLTLAGLLALAALRAVALALASRLLALLHGLLGLLGLLTHFLEVLLHRLHVLEGLFHTLLGL